jgi:hypothetical protein
LQVEWNKLWTKTWMEYSTFPPQPADRRRSA